MARITFENVRDVSAYYSWDPRVLLGLNSVPNQNYQCKAVTVGDLLILSAGITNYIDVGPWVAQPPQEVRVRLHTVRQTIPRGSRVNSFCFGTISQIAYADANHRVVPGVPLALSYNGGPTINVNIVTVHIEMDSWYFENYPLGFCVGMLCHEFAVHHMGSHLLTGMERRAERNTAGAIAGNWPPNVNPTQAGQRDHVFASCDTQPRYTKYRDTVIEVATAMVGRIGVVPAAGRVPVIASDVSDLLRCFLMDVASIQVTNDHRGRGLTQAGQVATCFNHHRTALLAHLGGAHVLVAHVPPTITAHTVRGNFMYLASSVLWSFLPNYSASWWGY